MNGNGKASGRSRPTNNQLLYKAYFRWQHYTSPLAPDVEQPEGTEACASVTSAFLQVLATIHRVESCRTDRPRNILHILSTNTRRTKVVELSSGTHRVADDLRRHSLPDGEGGHYSTNLDRNRYGSDNNYLFTVTKFNLDCLGLCPCLVDIEIVDTRNGNESQLVQAGAGACSCSSPARKERAAASHFAGSLGGMRPANRSPQQGGGAAAETLRRVSSTGHLSGGGSLRRIPSAPTMRRPPSSGRLHAMSPGEGGRHGEGGGGAHSRNSGGSELFDALLMAATEDHVPAPSRGDPPVTSAHYPNAALGRQRSRPWAASEVDSLQDAINAFKGAEEEVGTGGLSRMRSRRMLRRNSVSMIIENPVLAQTGAAESLLLNHYPPFQALPPLRSPGGAERTGPSRSARSGGGEGEHSVRSHEGDTDSKGREEQQEVTGADDHEAFREGLLRHYHKQSSAVNLSRMANPAEMRRLQEELRQLREENRGLESELEEARVAEKEAKEASVNKDGELKKLKVLMRRAADAIQQLKKAAQRAQQQGAADGPAADLAGQGAAEDQAAAAAAADLEQLVDAELAGVRTSEAELESLAAELASVRKQLARAKSKQAETTSCLDALTAACGGTAAAAAALRHHAAATAAAAAAPSLGLLPPPSAVAMGYGHGMYSAAVPSPMFGLPPLSPYALHAHHHYQPHLHHHAAAAAGYKGANGVAAPLHKVASMPTLGPGLMSPQAHLPIAPLGSGAGEALGMGGARRRRGAGSTSPIPEDEPDEAHGKRKRENGRLYGSRQQAMETPFGTHAEGEAGREGEGVSDSEGGQPPPRKAAKAAERVDQPAAEGAAAADDVSSGADGTSGREEDLTPGDSGTDEAVRTAQPPGTATPKDARLLPADPHTGASAAPLGLAPAKDAFPDGTAEVPVPGGGMGAGLQEAARKLPSPAAAAAQGACGEGTREEHAKLLASLAQ